MNAKLTLKLDRQIIEGTKQYARRHDTSLSRMVEDYFALMIRGPRTEPELNGTVAELAGIAKGVDVEDPKNSYASYLSKKYS